MTRDEFQKFHQKFCDDARAICKKKSKDYATDANVFHNFTKCERDGLCSTETGIMVRLSDKMIRLPNVIANGNACLDETALDTIQDAVNYLIILAGKLSEPKTQKLALPMDDSTGMSLEHWEAAQTGNMIGTGIGSALPYCKVEEYQKKRQRGPVLPEYEVPNPDDKVLYSTPCKEKGYTAGPSEHKTYFKKAKGTLESQTAEAPRWVKELTDEL